LLLLKRHTDCLVRISSAVLNLQTILHTYHTLRVAAVSGFAQAYHLITGTFTINQKLGDQFEAGTYHSTHIHAGYLYRHHGRLQTYPVQHSWLCRAYTV